MIKRTKNIDVPCEDARAYAKAINDKTVIKLPCGDYIAKQIDPYLDGKWSRVELVEVVSDDLKPRTRVEYVKCEFEHAWEAIKAQSETGCFLAIRPNDAEVFEADGLQDVLKWFERGEVLYRRVEREATWQDEMREFISDKGLIRYATLGEVADGTYLNNDSVNDFIAMCHLVTSMTDKPA